MTNRKSGTIPKPVPRRKRFTHRKRHQKGSKKDVSVHDPGSQVPGLNDFIPQPCEFSEEQEGSLQSILLEHDYSSHSKQSSAVDDSIEKNSSTCPTGPLPQREALDLLMDVRDKLKLFLCHRWFSIVSQNYIQVCLLSRGCNVSIQRNIVLYLDGDVKIFVHGKQVSSEPFMPQDNAFLPLQADTVNFFVDRAATITSSVKNMQVCAGVENEEYQPVWTRCSFGEVDRNPFNECRYSETFRSLNCNLLVNAKKWTCSECLKLKRPLKRKATAAAQEPNVYTANVYLSEEQKLQKLEEQRRELNNAKRKISRLQTRMQELIKTNGVQIEETLSDDLTHILESAENITPAQSIFIQQQVKASQAKKLCGMRWHPTMIRFALSIHLTSPAAYELMRDTGIIKFPSRRTLFDYSHVKPLAEGIDKVVLDSLGERVGKLLKPSQKYFVLMADEMHISQNLIFQKGSGKLVGYTTLNTLDEEIKSLDYSLDNPEKEVLPSIASKVMVYMVKGVANNIKEVVATYGVGNLSVNQMYQWTWKVIRALESSGVAVIVFVCDGCSVNRAFIKKHKPVTVLPSGITCDTLNKAAPHRVLYFMSDVPHLLKTARNCFLNSRSGKKKSLRKMQKSGKKILWDHIIKLYNVHKDKALRKTFKLTVMNVFPDSYARMKAAYAAQILSRTVAQHLEDMKWSHTSETITFIRNFNDWFDCLNGARSGIAQKKRNPRLDRYSNINDERFEFLESVLKYLEEWKLDAATGNSNLNVTVESDVADTPESGESLLEEEGVDAAEETPANKRLLSKQTLDGIEMTTRAFIAATKFLISEGTIFVNARVFTQDPLEQHFSKVRAGQGGSNNPNIGQVLKRNRALFTIGQMKMKRRRGNAAEVDEGGSVSVSCEPLPKRANERRAKFLEFD